MVEPAERPVAPHFARLAAGDPSVPNLRHRSVLLNDLERKVLPLLDGSRDAAALASETGQDAAAIAAKSREVGARLLLDTFQSGGVVPIKAQEWGVVVLVKGPYTVIANPEGQLAVLPFATAALAP